MAYNILVVDDSSPMRAIIKKIIKASGFNVGQFFEASNGKEALATLKKEWADLVLTDYKMPDMDGLELISELKVDDEFMDIPVLMVTTEGSQKRLNAFMEKGAADYIKKPFTPEEIRKKLNHIMGETDDGEGSPDQGDEDLDF